jgi:asparagine synthase (glutamine-hydrolysing)
VAGIAGVGYAGHEPTVREMLGAIIHRGGSGTFTRSCRAATIGATWPEAQAPFAPHSTQHAVLDGEIYNWRDLGVVARRPLDALEKACRAQGAQVLRRLDGPFAVAIARPEGVLLARDSIGQSPLYYGWHEGRIYFSSELKALAGRADDIKEFPPGYFYDPAAGFAPYSGTQKLPTLDCPAEDIAASLRQRLEAAVRKRAGGPEVGAWLSGGLDSATMTALARQAVGRVKTFAIGVPGAPDLRYARDVAESAETDHHERVCSCDEMLAALPQVIYHLESFDALLVRSSITNYMVAQLASDHVGIVLSGEGGDELFAGYSYLKALDEADLPDELTDITGRLHNTALQRVDRCAAAHGLIPRLGFLDREVVDYAFRIPSRLKIARRDRVIEKWILREAVKDLLPRPVAMRPKAKFWEGAGVGTLLKEHAEKTISDSEFRRARRLPDGSRLASKEEFLYYRVFRDALGDLSPSLVGRTKGAPQVT